MGRTGEGGTISPLTFSGGVQITPSSYAPAWSVRDVHPLRGGQQQRGYQAGRF